MFWTLVSGALKELIALFKITLASLAQLGIYVTEGLTRGNQLYTVNTMVKSVQRDIIVNQVLTLQLLAPLVLITQNMEPLQLPSVCSVPQIPSMTWLVKLVVDPVELMQVQSKEPQLVNVKATSAHSLMLIHHADVWVGMITWIRSLRLPLANRVVLKTALL